MSNTFTIRLTEELSRWLAQTSKKTGLPIGRIIRAQLERAKTEIADTNGKPWMKLAGCVKGLDPKLSTRKGFSRK